LGTSRSVDDDGRSLSMGGDRRFLLVLLPGDTGFERIFIVTTGEGGRLPLPNRERFDSIQNIDKNFKKK